MLDDVPGDDGVPRRSEIVKLADEGVGEGSVHGYDFEIAIKAADDYSTLYEEVEELCYFGRNACG